MIDLKKYSVNKIGEYDLDYEKAEDLATLSLKLNVIFNGKQIGTITARSGSMRGSVFIFTAHHDSLIPNLQEDSLEKIKQVISDDIKKMIKFVAKHYDL